MNAKLAEVTERVDALQEKMDENTNGLADAQEKIESVEKKVEKVEKKVEDMGKNTEDGMDDELQAREAIKRNLVLYGVKEPDQSITDGRERAEADKVECEKIFTAAGSKA